MVFGGVVKRVGGLWTFSLGTGGKGHLCLVYVNWVLCLLCSGLMPMPNVRVRILALMKAKGVQTLKN